MTDHEESGAVSNVKCLETYKLELGEHSIEISDNEEDLDGFFYIPNFISEQEEEFLIDKINSAPRPKWKELQARRLQYWGGQLTEKQILIPEALPDFLCYFPPLVERIKEHGAFRNSKHGEPNHCLVNEYKSGQGILPHEDGGAYFAAVATISMGSHTLLDVYRYNEKSKSYHDDSTEARSREQKPRFSILQERRSLLVTRGAAYKQFLHGIAERSQDGSRDLRKIVNSTRLVQPDICHMVKKSESDDTVILKRDTRISLTFRDVERVAPRSLVKMFMKR